MGLDVVERVELFKQNHLPYLSELASLNGVDVHASGYRLTKVVGGIPLNRAISCGLLTIYQGSDTATHQIIYSDIDIGILWQIVSNLRYRIEGIRVVLM